MPRGSSSAEIQALSASTAWDVYFHLTPPPWLGPVTRVKKKKETSRARALTRVKKKKENSHSAREL